MNVDLHTHSTASDGMNTPSENVRNAKKIGLVALGITDHDTVNGIDEALQTAKEIGFEIVPGIEISTSHNGQDIHVLGYYINYQDKNFLDSLEELANVREKRNNEIIRKLNELGIDITMEEVYSKVRRTGAKPGRPHIGELLLEKKVCRTMKEVFDRYLGNKGRAYVNVDRINPEQAIDMIKKAGGAPVLAHPGIYGDDELIISLIKYGLAGIEVYHPDHNLAEEKKYKLIAREYGIIATGGSDYHGSRGEQVFHAALGSKNVSYQVIEDLKDLVKV